MDGLSNLADAMLVLAVGIMLALVIHWNVDISTLAYNPSSGEEVDTEDALSFDEGDLEQTAGDEADDDDGMQRLGTVWYDEATGKYYVIEDDQE